MEGDSEKQVAMRMGLSRTTVHQYVTMLYRRFDVQSRAELLARVLRRRGIRHGLPTVIRGASCRNRMRFVSAMCAPHFA